MSRISPGADIGGRIMMRDKRIIGNRKCSVCTSRQMLVSRFLMPGARVRVYCCRTDRSFLAFFLACTRYDPSFLPSFLPSRNRTTSAAEPESLRILLCGRDRPCATLTFAVGLCKTSHSPGISGEVLSSVPRNLRIRDEDIVRGQAICQDVGTWSMAKRKRDEFA